MISNKYFNNLLNKHICLMPFLFIGLYIISGIINNNIYTNIEIIGIQSISLICFTTLFIIGKNFNIRTILFTTFIYQLILSIWLYSFFCIYIGNPLGYNPIDSQLYLDIVSHTVNIDIKEFIPYMESTGYNFSDYGFPFIQRYIYILAGSIKNGLFIMIITNIISHTITTFLLYKLSSLLISKHDAKIIALLWGINIYSVYFNVSGLKEQIFILIIISMTYYLYLYKDNSKILPFILFFIFLILSCFFRYYITLFYIITFCCLYYFKSIYNQLFPIYIISLFIISFGAINLLILFIPELYFAVNNTSELLENKVGGGLVWQILSVFMAFIGPIPKVTNTTLSNSTLSEFFTLFKYFLSTFGILAIISIIKSKNTIFYPIINIVIFNVILLVLSGHFFNMRFIYVTLPLYFILIIYGLRVFGNKTYANLSYLILFILMIIFNTKFS